MAKHELTHYGLTRDELASKRVAHLAPNLDIFTRHYLIAALWSSTNADGVPLDSLYDVEDIAPDFVRQALADCLDFQRANAELLKQAYAFYRVNGNAAHPDAGSAEACAGHDFWFTRNRHGAGFWDRGMGAVGQRLTDASHVYGEIELMPEHMTRDALVRAGMAHLISE